MPQECHDAKDTEQKATEAYHEVMLLHCTAEVRLCFLLLAFHLPSRFSQKDMGVQCYSWECGIAEEGCAAQKGKGWGSLVFHTHSSLLTFFPTAHSGHISVRRLGKWLVSRYRWMLLSNLYSLTGWELSYLCPRNPELKVYKKDWVFQNLSLWTQMVPEPWYPSVESFLFPPPSHLI